MAKNIKTNVCRVLDAAKINYNTYCYADTDAVSGVDVAAAMGQDPKRVFKTLVTEAKGGMHLVFVIPVEAELDLKKAAAASGQKAISMLKQKDLLPLTGYIHGGCSPIGMKKQFETYIHESAKEFETIIFSAGKIGYQVEVSPEDLLTVVPYKFADVVVE